MGEEKKQIDIQTISVTELKALAYDVIADIEQKQKFLKAINSEIIKKGNAPKIPPPEGEPKK